MSLKIAVVFLVFACAATSAEYSRPSRFIAARQAELEMKMQDAQFKTESLDCSLFGNCADTGATACNVQGCAACYSGYTQYCAQCSYGYTRTSNYQCAATCTVPNCATCYSGTAVECWQCNAGYQQTSTYQCAAVAVTCNVQYCSACTAGSSTTCSVCNSGYVKTSTGQCTLGCSVANCAACVSGSSTQCQTCNSGFAVSNGQCVSTACTVPNCAICYANTATECWTCATGYSQTATYQCAPNTVVTCSVANCVACVSGSSTQCQTCATGYSLSTSHTCNPPATAGTLQQYIAKDLSVEHTLRPIENQGQCGSCASFATAHTVNDNILTSGMGCTNTPLSEQYIVDCLQKVNPSITSYCSQGASMRDLWNFWSTYGSTANSCLAYHAAVLQCPTACDGGTPFPLMAKSASTCVVGVAAMQAALNAGHTLAIGIPLKAQFQTDYISTTFACNNLYPHAGGATNIIGGHAMEVVGYGTYNGQVFWKLKNSWGTGWGCHGFVYLASGEPGFTGQAFENEGACYASPSTCIASSPFDTQSKAEGEVEFPAGSRLDRAEKMHMQNIKTYDASQLPTADANIGGIQPASLGDPLVNECATFAAEVLLALPKAQGGFECISNVNNSFHPTGSDMEASMVNVQIFSGDQQLVGGQLIHVIFGFSTTDSRCGGAGGNFDSTVHVDPTGRLILTDVHKSAASFPSTGINKSLIYEIAGPAGFVAVLVVALLIVRWRMTRSQYQKLQSLHGELVRRVTQIESDDSSGFDKATRARLTQVLGPADDWTEYKPRESISASAAPIHEQPSSPTYPAASGKWSKVEPRSPMSPMEERAPAIAKPPTHAKRRASVTLSEAPPSTNV